MSLLFDQNELEDVGPPTRSDLRWAAFVVPIFGGLTGVCAYRLFRVILGEDLRFSAVFDISLSVAGGALSFGAGIALYVAVLAVALSGIWWCAIQLQRWLYWRR